MLKYLLSLFTFLPPYSGLEVMQETLNQDCISYLQNDKDPDCVIILNSWTNIAGVRQNGLFIWSCSYRPVFTDEIHNFGIPLNKKTDVYLQVSLLRFRGYKVAWEEEAFHYYLYGILPPDSLLP